MSDRTDRRPKFDPQAVLEAERLELIARHAELAGEHERIVRRSGEGYELIRRMYAHGDLAALTLEMYQALPGFVSSEQALEAMAVLVHAKAAIELLQAGLAQLDLEHLANHAEDVLVAAAIEETDAALERLASQATEPFDQTREPAAAEARAAG